MLPEKLIVTASRYNGLQLSVESKTGERWRYLRVGLHHGLDVVYGTAVPADVSDTLRTMAADHGEEAARYAAGHLEHADRIIDLG